MGRPLLRLTLEAFSREWTEEEGGGGGEGCLLLARKHEKRKIQCAHQKAHFCYLRPKHGLRLTVCLKRGFYKYIFESLGNRTLFIPPTRKT